MIYPSIYSFNAPYRGPKESDELNKLFTSIIYDLSIGYDELELQASRLPNNLGFCVKADLMPVMSFPTAGMIDGTYYTYRGIDTAGARLGITQAIDNMKARIDQILENL